MVTEATSRVAMPWPLFTIDFEASSLEPGSYPIEVGICRWLTPERPIEGWSTLIKPAAVWNEQGSWSRTSQSIHGIAREELEHGVGPSDVIRALNAITGGHPAFCDGGEHDLRWARTLASASEIRPVFALGDFDHLGTRLDQLGYMRVLRWMDRAPPRHRARDDAERLMKALARGLGAEHGTSQDIAID